MDTAASVGPYRLCRPAGHSCANSAAVSAGSACSSGSLKTSHVLMAMGWSEDAAREVIRVSFGPQTRESDIDALIAAWTALAAKRRAA